MITDNWHPAFALAGSDVALDVEQTTGNNPVTGRDLNDMMQNVITGSNKVRAVFVSA